MVHELEAPAQFLAAEIVRQPLRRIDERVPGQEGCSPVHIAVVVIYRAVRATQTSGRAR